MDAEVIVVGCGFSGSVAAFVLANQGISVKVLERKETYPNVFRAEKLEPNQVEYLSKFGLFESRKPLAEPIGKTVNYRRGTRSLYDTVNQYGINYSATVNNFRRYLERDVCIDCVNVIDIKNSPDLQKVITKDKEYSCRLVVVATGGSDKLLNKIDIHRRYHSSLSSLNFAFDIELNNKSKLGCNGFNYYVEDKGLDYMTVFRVGVTMRVNIFTQWPTSSLELTKMRKNPAESLARLFPDFEREVGSFTIVSKVQSFPTRFYRLSDVNKDGVTVIGDDYQSVSPATGSGLDKISVDVDRLCNSYIPQWLKTAGMGNDKISQYYSDGEKQSVDNKSLEMWIHYRDNHRNFLGQQLSKLELRYKRMLKWW